MNTEKTKKAIMWISVIISIAKAIIEALSTDQTS